MNKKVTALFILFMALIFLVSVSPVFAASSNKKELQKTSTVKKKQSSSTHKKSTKNIKTWVSKQLFYSKARLILILSPKNN